LIRENVSLASYTTLAIGGPARYFIEAGSETAVLDALAFAEARNLPVFVLGGGSNVVVADRGFPGLVLRVTSVGLRPGSEPGVVSVGAGEDWDAFVAYCVARNWAGLECLSGIPGLVGGAPIQNIGAYGAEVSEVLIRVRALDREARSVVDLDNAACGFAYRSSRFNSVDRNRFVVLEVEFALRPGGAPRVHYPDLARRFTKAPPRSLGEVRAAVREIRASKSMLLVAGDPDARSAGSFFKNPIVSGQEAERVEVECRRLGRMSAAETMPRFPAGPERVKIPAAWLIERCGIQKGYVSGRAGVSTRHTLALVNRGGATAAELLALAEEIRARVHATFGVGLETEPVMVGFD
jgi:UDP-N-acetylmuramate dehydrogenase